MGAVAAIRPYLVAGVGGAALAFVGIAETARGSWTSAEIIWIGLAVLPQYLIGVWLVRRRPDHLQARRLLLAASSAAVGSAIEELVTVLYPDGQPGSAFWLINLLYGLNGTVGLVAGTTMIALYPAGVAERPWMRRTVRGLWAICALPPLLLLVNPTLVVDVWMPVDPGPWPNPWAVEWLSPLAPPLVTLATWYWFFALVGPALLLWRYRRAPARERAVMRLLLVTLLVAVAALGLWAVGRLLGLDDVWAWDVLFGVISVGSQLMIAISILVGVLRHGLFDIDLVVRRSAVFAVLWLGIAVLYIVVAATPGLALGAEIPVQLAVLLTIAVALLFQPVRRRLESWADRRVFGRRVDQYDLLRRLGATLEQSIDLGELMPRLADAVRMGLGSRWVRVALPGEAGTWPADAQETSGNAVGEPELTQELRRAGQVIGRIDCGPKPGGYTADDRDLLETLSRQAATAIANVGLTAQLSERLGELARSRARIVAAQDAERRRIERDIHDGAQQEVVALITKLRLARNQVQRGNSPDALLAEMQRDARELLADLRELAHGIHPPVLSDNGLVAAVEARAGRLPLPVLIRAEDGIRTRRLPEDVEGAAYFVICEALTNVLKHAAASEAEICLAATGAALTIDVSDDGSGFGAPARGIGLTNSRDRVEALGGRLLIDSRPGAGTRLHAELPVPRAGDG